MTEIAVLKVYRCDPSSDRKPRYDRFEVPFTRQTKLISSLQYIRENLDASLAIRYSCVWKTRRCGTCAMFINGKPGAACFTPLTKRMTIEPLPGFPVIRDLVVDWESYESLIQKLWGEVSGESASPDLVSTNKYRELAPYAGCIRCFSCVAVCPARAAYPDFIGPAAFVQLARWALDPRAPKKLGRELLETGLYDCLRCTACEKVCPVDIPIVDAILAFRDHVEMADFAEAKRMKEMTLGRI